MTRVNEMKELVEKQKQIALHTPVYIIGNDGAIASLEPITQKFSDIFENPNAFKTVHNNEQEIDVALAKAVNRTLVFYLFKSDRIYQEAWFEEGLKQKFEEDGGVDVHAIDVCKSFFEELNYLKELKITKYPCVLTYRAGHLIDIFYPELQKGNSVAEKLVELKYVQQKKFQENYVKFDDSGNVYDADKLAFEERMRKKQAEQIQREEEEKKRYLLEVKRKIEQDKKDRRQKYGKI
ncbi:hypothetical protein TVAG_096750 [Trichomonas vaginalis G3]|uniref:Thioredoxin domain-containing protein n=1 Tax=Trichomonas vaginalis (strain ATCC PRA-98 / G3) TaxID=412133 RepID=A2F2X1_TRIV3|nr:hypothetical protein TVAGG3_0342300 [Trichomonas vaginalis G3]EAY00764.1 hypothetical protein TVAG_096750 [Trichomonas vaginalis G3]KAI5530732.1 hypothetical protein TVAGG3_0342300 [Trichomonas vaginalis G3]|eukprot:XP_001313693.1 hypothetical protein [Trichomonas vaginalis G3]